jgi:hypothetical protein
MATIYWAFAAMFCALALFVEASRIVVALFISRQSLWRYLFVLLPLTVSVVSFIMTLNVLVKWESMYIAFPWGGHIPSFAYHAFMAHLSQLSSACQQQVVITLVALALTIFLERGLLPSGIAFLTVGRARDRYFASQVSLMR